MQNFTINQESKRITVIGTLTQMEKDIIGIYIAQGYTAIPKTTRKGKKSIKKEDIINYFKNNNDNKGLKQFESKQQEEIINKNGKTMKAGYLYAIKWFRETYPDAYKEITAAADK